MNIKKIIQCQRGYTVVETLVASAILMGVLIPSLLFLGRATASQANRDRVVASQLAVEEMERTIAFSLHEYEERVVQLNRKTWRVVRLIDNQMGLVEIRVQVSKPTRNHPIIEMKTFQFSGQ